MTFASISLDALRARRALTSGAWTKIARIAARPAFERAIESAQLCEAQLPRDLGQSQRAIMYEFDRDTMANAILQSLKADVALFLQPPPQCGARRVQYPGGIFERQRSLDMLQQNGLHAFGETEFITKAEGEIAWHRIEKAGQAALVGNRRRA